MKDAFTGTAVNISAETSWSSDWFAGISRGVCLMKEMLDERNNQVGGVCYVAATGIFFCVAFSLKHRRTSRMVQLEDPISQVLLPAN